MTATQQHTLWTRTFILLCSAVVIRMIGGLGTVLEFDALWLYPASCWMSWLLPLLAFESWQVVGQRLHVSRPLLPKAG